MDGRHDEHYPPRTSHYQGACPVGIIFTIGLIAYLGFLAVAYTWEAIGHATSPRVRAGKQQRARALAHARETLEARAPMPLPVPIPAPSWLPISHDDILSLLSPSMRAEFSEPKKDEPSSSSITPLVKSAARRSTSR